MENGRRAGRRKGAMKNYDESVMDEYIDMHLGVFSKKRIKTQDELDKETRTEAMIALSLGFPIEELLDEEIQANVITDFGGKDQNNYIVVRNHILSRWRDNVQVFMSKSQINETVSSEFQHLINAAYDFLLHNGYINFGVLPSFESLLQSQGTEGCVVIIGAGLAGLAAARQLMSFGFRVLVIEARHRPGGRVYTQKMGREGKFAAVDLGGSVITGTHANPLGVLARQLSIPLHKIKDECPFYRSDGLPVDGEIDSKVELVFNKLLDKVTELREILGERANNSSLGFLLEMLRQLYGAATNTEERQLLDWHFANLEYANAGCLSQLSAANWDQDDPYEMGGDHCFLAGGNGTLINALCRDVPIRYGQNVQTIRYGNQGVKIITSDSEFTGEMVICTVPLGVLKRKKIKFEPELPERKLEAIERVGFGLLNKVVMVFPYVFWGEDLDTFGHLNESSHTRGEFFLFYSYHTVSGGPVLAALVAGEAAQSFEHTSVSTLLHRVLNILKGIYGRKGVIVPDPIQSICTRWGNDPFCYGSYSHVRVQSSGSDYDILAESVGNRLFFAGEATNRKYPATMHGAYLSGLREASQILQIMRAKRNSQKKCLQKNVGYSNDCLIDLFKKPDLVVGQFCFVFDPLSEDPKSLGMIKASFRRKSNDHSGHVLSYQNQNGYEQQLDLYAVLSREQAIELLQVAGGNKHKLAYACRNLGLKFQGANEVSLLSNGLVASIYRARKGKLRNHSFQANLNLPHM
ncbi:oxidase [Lithospermum erythrorhizon]|uniref:Oxidase n=1 Tax=Lithospermum erythrorhizon TaxID=34254 RepID=A0AAV3P2V0_LITER